MIDITDKCMVVDEMFIDKSIRRNGELIEEYSKKFISITMRASRHELLREVVIIEGKKCFLVHMNPVGHYVLEIVA